MKINSTESYVFFLARTYRARIQLSFTNTGGIQYSPYVNLCVSPYSDKTRCLIIGHSMKINLQFQLTFLGSCNSESVNVCLH